MEEDIKRVYDTFSKVVDLVKDIDAKTQKQEKLLLATFSYLYNRLDEIQQEISPSYDDKWVKKEISDIKENILSIIKTTEELKTKAYNENVAEEQSNTVNIIKKRKKPWHYFFTKYRKYKKLLEQKHQLELEIEEREEIRRKEAEEKRKAEEERRKEFAEQEKLKSIKRKQEAQRKSAEILRTLYNK